MNNFNKLYLYHYITYIYIFILFNIKITKYTNNKLTRIYMESTRSFVLFQSHYLPGGFLEVLDSEFPASQGSGRNV